jgi:hypothetical protein
VEPVRDDVSSSARRRKRERAKEDGVERLRWTLVSPQDDLDPTRYYGEFPELPLAGGPGDWCRVVVHDELGDMRWTLIVVDAAPIASIFADRRPPSDVLDSNRQAEGRIAEHVAERVG